MAQLFRPYEPHQALLLPPSLDDWLPANHLARFVSDTVDALDIGPFFKKYREREDGRGRVAYHPKLMLKVLIYAYSTGIFSSRKIYKRRKTLVEPVFGWIKSVLGFRSFSLRGLRGVEGEWNLVCLALNLRRMAPRITWV